MAGPEPTAAVPKRIGRHEVVGYIATGGMAELFLGKEAAGKPVVIKRILPHLARQASFVSMFIDEARIGSMAKHPNLVEVHELGQVGTDLFLVMEYLVGENLSGLQRRLVRRGEQFPYGLAAWLIAEVCDGLHAAHEMTDAAGNHLALVHRDVSPQNVFVTYGGDVKLLDFGVATAAHRLTQTASGQVKGKYAYMSPEQCRGEPLDRRSDLFSLGTVLYELTTMRRLFKRTNELQTMKAICDEPIPAPSREVQGYPTVLERICTKALARDRDERYATALEMRADLLRAVDELGIGGSSHEVLASTLGLWFGDRVEQKHELLARVHAGGELADLLRAEVDEGIELPPVANLTATPLSAVRASSQGSKSTKRKQRGLRGAALGLGVAVLIGGGIGFALRSHRGGATTADAALVTAVHDSAPPAPLSPDVVVSVETEPLGVHVLVDGTDRGITPLDLKVPRGASSVTFELRAPGFQPQAQDVTPDKDQRLFFSMAQVAKKPPPAPKKGAPKKDGPGFHRFD